METPASEPAGGYRRLRTLAQHVATTAGSPSALLPNPFLGGQGTATAAAAVTEGRVVDVVDYEAVLAAYFAQTPHVSAQVRQNGGLRGGAPSPLNPIHTAWSWPDASGLSFPAGERPRRLFDGASLDGWHGKKGRYWRAEGGSIIGECNPADAPQVSTYLFTDSSHHLNFRLLFEIRLVQADMHSGVGFWGRRNTMTCPKSGEVQTDAWQGHLAILPTACATPPKSQAGVFEIYRRNWQGTDREKWGSPGHPVQTTSSGNSLVGDQAELGQQYGSSHGWNQTELLCVGGRVRIVTNGVVTTDWTDPDPSMVSPGPIALQLHKMDIGQAQEVHFRGLVIVDDPSDVLLSVKDDGGCLSSSGVEGHPCCGAWPSGATFPLGEAPRALFNGSDLSGWIGKKGRYFSVNGAGSIVAKNNPADPLGPSTALLTESHHRNFRLLLEMRLVQSEMHSGIYFWGEQHSYAPPGYETEEFTYKGHLALVPGSNAQEGPWGLFDFYRRNWKEDRSKGSGGSGAMLVQDTLGMGMRVGSPHGWNQIELLCVGARVRMALNGCALLDWMDPSPELIKAGPIGLQCHWMPLGSTQETHFRGLVVVDDPTEDRLITLR